MDDRAIFTSQNTDRNAGLRCAPWRRWLPSVLLAGMLACNPPPPPLQADQTAKINELQTKLNDATTRADEATKRTAALTTENKQLKQRVDQLEASISGGPGQMPAGAVACVPPEPPTEAGGKGGKHRRGRRPPAYAMVTPPRPNTAAGSGTGSSLPPPSTVGEQPPPPAPPPPPPSPPAQASDPAAQAAKLRQQQIATITTVCTTKKRDNISTLLRFVSQQAKQNRATALETLKEEERKAGRAGCEQGQCSIGPASSPASQRAQSILQGKYKGGILRAIKMGNPALFSKNKALLSTLVKDTTTEDPGEDETVATSIISAVQTIDKECDEKIQNIRTTSQEASSKSSQQR